MPFPDAQNIRFEPKVASKPFSKKLHTTKLKKFWCFASLSQKTVSTSSLNNFRKTEQCPFQTLETFVFELNVASKPFSKKLHMTELKSFRCFASFSPKIVSTSSIKNLQKTEKCPFQTLRPFVFELKVASKPFSKKSPMTNL